MMRVNHIRPRSAGSLALVATLALGAAACGNLTAGGATGEARVTLSGDAPDLVAPASRAPAVVAAAAMYRASSSGPALADDQPEGQLEAEFQLYLISDAGAALELTDGHVSVKVDLEGVEEPEVAAQVIDATGYSTFRIVFNKIEAEVDAGLVINGDTITGLIDVDIEDVSLTVDIPLPIDVGSAEVVEILVDLNAREWLQAVDPITGVVTAQAFASFIDVVVR